MKYFSKRIGSYVQTLRFVAAFVLSLSLISATAQANSPKDEASNAGMKKTDAVILIQSAQSATIVQDKSQPGLYKITLNNVIPFLSYVGDRPNRTIGKIGLDKYLRLWQVQGQDSFRDSPPNAIFHVISSQERIPLYFALELSEPKYNAQSNTLEYKAKALSGDISNIPANASFDHITIIIDDVCIGCWN